MRKWKNKTGTKIYYAWRSMRARCREDAHCSHNYHQRGITVCEEWANSYDTFYEDMIKDHADTLELDRIDNNKGYYKDNCRWVLSSANLCNTRRNVKVTNEGVTLTIKEWCISLGLSKTEQSKVYKRHSKYNATSYDELFTKERLSSQRARMKVHVCSVCNTSHSIKWRRNMCNNCYAKHMRNKKRDDIAGYSTLVSRELVEDYDDKG